MRTVKNQIANWEKYFRHISQRVNFPDTQKTPPKLIRKISSLIEKWVHRKVQTSDS